MKFLLHYDVETTGFPDWKVPSDDPIQPHIVQLAAILCNAETKEVVESIDVIIKPEGWVIPQSTTDIHGISTRHALDVGIPEKEACLMLVNMLEMAGPTERVAYNKTFDQRIIRIALKRYFPGSDALDRWAIKEDHHCAMRMAKQAIGGKNPKLVDAYKHFTGNTLENAHNAMADTRACMDVYFAAKKVIDG